MEWQGLAITGVLMFYEPKSAGSLCPCPNGKQRSGSSCKHYVDGYDCGPCPMNCMQMWLAQTEMSLAVPYHIASGTECYPSTELDDFFSAHAGHDGAVCWSQGSPCYIHVADDCHLHTAASVI